MWERGMQTDGHATWCFRTEVHGTRLLGAGVFWNKTKQEFTDAFLTSKVQQATPMILPGMNFQFLSLPSESKVLLKNSSSRDDNLLPPLEMCYDTSHLSVCLNKRHPYQ